MRKKPMAPSGLTFKEWLKYYYGWLWFLHNNSLERLVYSFRQDVIREEPERGNPPVK